MDEKVRHLKALDEIYKIYAFLHRSTLKISVKFRQTFSYFYKFIFKDLLISSENLSKIHEFHQKFAKS